MRRDDLQRFSYLQRVVHWTVGLSFLLLLFTGLAFSYPALFWLNILVGGGAAARVIHPWAGIVFSVAFALMFLIWAREMLVTKLDREWLGAIKAYAKHDQANVPATGKYNGGQKLFFWVQAFLGLLLLLTGLPLWLPASFSGDFLTTMRLLHYLAGLGSGLFIIVHIYLSTVAYPGTFIAMISGRVTRPWAKLHHALWHEEQIKS